MPRPLPISKQELNQLLGDPQALIRRMILSFALERPRRLRVPQQQHAKPEPEKSE